MWPSLFDDIETKASFYRLRGRYDERMAFMVAAIDGAFRKRLQTSYTPLKAYAESVAEAAEINAKVEGYSPTVAAERRREVYEKTLREGLDDPNHPQLTWQVGRADESCFGEQRP